jgi:hypothetical protein
MYPDKDIMCDVSILLMLCVSNNKKKQWGTVMYHLALLLEPIMLQTKLPVSVWWVQVTLVPWR